MSEETGSDTRAIELEIQVDAPPEKVWDALTEAEALASWFPLDCRVEGAGHGARVWLSWGGDAEWPTTITHWEPHRHLRWVDDPDTPDAPAVDFHLEGENGGTLVRLVNSGFSGSSEADEIYEATLGGWTYFLFNLKHYLERHAGVSRRMVWSRRPTSEDRATVWERVLGPDGLNVRAENLEQDATFRFSLGNGDSLGGTVRYARPPVHFAGTVEELDGALLFIEMEPGGARWKCGVWLSTYGLPAERADALQAALDRRLDTLFAGTEG